MGIATRAYRDSRAAHVLDLILVFSESDQMII